MDLLIELLVWIFKALTGENAKDSPKPGDAKPPVPQQRGPYNYGDSRTASPARPKTLEEILEEVKRQQAQARQGGARPGAPAAPRSAPPPIPAPRAKVPTLSRPLSEVQPASSRPSAPPAQGGATPSNLETRMLKQSLDEKEIVKPGLERKFDKILDREGQIGRGIGRSKDVSEVNTVAVMGDVQGVAAGTDSELAARKVSSYTELFRSLRTAPPLSRVDILRRAFVFNEVFGAPRAMRPLRRR